jgi:chloride channel protein, CIC family
MTDPAATHATPPQHDVMPLPSERTAASLSPAPAAKQHLWESWSRWIFAIGEDRMFLILSVLIGVFSGLAVVCFHIAIEFTRFLFLGSSLSPSVLRVLLAPTLGGLGVGLLALRIFPRSRGSGVNQTKLAVYVLNGYISFRTVISKFTMCALAIGSGQSLGPEDPALHMGAGIASAIGRGLKLSQKKVRMMAPIGAAAGLAAAFNAPMSAVVFVIEEVIGTWSAGVLGAIVLAAFSSAVTMRWFLGANALFRVPRFEVSHPSELIAYLVLGVVGGLLSLAFLKWIEYARPRVQALPAWTRNLQPAIAGLMIGIIAIKAPQVMGAGYIIIDEALHGQFTWKLLLILALLKVLATGISFLSGTPGGLFAPALFIGAVLGGAVGTVEQHLFPHVAGTVATFALVGMATFFAGFLRVPITAVFMAIELSGSYTAIAPVVISTMVAYLISRRYQKMPLFDLIARQDGVVLPSIEELREQVTLVAEDAMRQDAAMVAEPDDPISDVARRLEGKPDVSVLLRAKVGEWRLLDRAQILKFAAAAGVQVAGTQATGTGVATGPQAATPPAGEARTGAAAQTDEPADGAAPAGPDGKQPRTAADLESKGPLPLVFPDESLEEALRWAGDWPLLPVVNRADLGKLEGVLTLADILKAFRSAAAE